MITTFQPVLLVDNKEERNNYHVHAVLLPDKQDSSLGWEVIRLEENIEKKIVQNLNLTWTKAFIFLTNQTSNLKCFSIKLNSLL